MTRHDAPDTSLPSLTVAQADRLRTLTADHFAARHGIRPAVTADAVEHDGHRYPLANLARWCRDAPEETWPDLVGQHFTRLESASRGDEDAERLLRGTRLRLLPHDAFPADAADRFRYVRPVAEDLVVALALDAPETVRVLGDSDVARAGLDALWAAGRANLLAEPVEHTRVPAPSGALLHSVHGDSPFVSSKALVLPELVREVTGRDLPEAGALVAVPTRHLLAFHPIVDGTVVDAVNDLQAYAFGAYQDGPGALTPRLYWWHGGRLVCVTAFDRDSRVLSVVPPPELLELMRTLHGAGRPASAEPGVRTAPDVPDVDGLARTVAEATERLTEDPSAFPFALETALAHALARCADDADAAELGTWEAWVTAMQIGSALFATTLVREGTVDCRIGDRVLALPATGPAPHATARAWLDAFCLALVCREAARLRTLAMVPTADLRRAGPDEDDYLFHWIDTLQGYFGDVPVDDVVPRLVATMETSHPQVATRTPADFLNLVDYQPVAVFHRVLTGQQDLFPGVLAEALAHHARYYDGSSDPRRHVALGPLAMACLAHERGFPVDTASPHLPKHLVLGSWRGEFDT
ncbi:immunity 49 family protein [Streptomyces sp. NPDC017936]|uniref:immunity 49 family protein n=1 Tax=unclassified Streptomyces TaxID=2593676 RepID=UPI0037AB5086